MKKRNRVRLVAVALVVVAQSILPPFACADGTGSHGGWLIQCGGQATRMLDDYQAGMESEGQSRGEVPAKRMLRLDETSELQTIHILMRRLERFPFFIQKMAHRLNLLGTVKRWKKSEVVMPPTPTLVYGIPSGCKLVPVAAQYLRIRCTSARAPSR